MSASLHAALALQQRVIAGASLDEVLAEIAHIAGAHSATFERAHDATRAPAAASMAIECSGETFVLSLIADHALTIDRELLQLLAGFAMSAELQLREHGYLKLLQAIAVAANESSSVEEAIRRSLALICEATGWPMGHLYLTSERGDRLISTPVWNITHDSKFNALRRLTDAMEWRRGTGLPGRVLAEAKPAWMTDIRKDPSIVRTAIATSLGVHSSFALPLLAGSDVVAVLEFFAEEELEPDEKLLEIAGHVGVQLGRVIERKRASMTVAASEQHYRLLFERNVAGVFRMASDGRLLDCNESLARILGYESRDALRSRLLFEQSEHWEQLQATSALNNCEMLMQRDDGTPIWTLVNASLLGDGDDAVVEGTLLDITARKEQEMRVEFQAQHDGLTKLHNRAFFRAQLEKSIALAVRYDHPLALLFMDLDGFKPINDTLGHAAGDWLLQETAARLVQSVRNSDLVARLGGDEFVVLLTSLTNAGDAETVAAKLLARLEAPFVYADQSLRISASIGIGLFPHDAYDAESLIAAADDAMYSAKKEGGRRYRFFRAAPVVS